MEIIRGVNDGGDDESLAESNGVTRRSSDISTEQAEDQWDDTTTEEKPTETPAGTTEDSDNDEPDWEPEAESMEVLDDPVRMYLREIGRVRLLTSIDERTLARKIEGGKHLKGIQKEFSDVENRQPKSWEVTLALFRRMGGFSPLVESLGKQLGFLENLPV